MLQFLQVTNIQGSVGDKLERVGVSQPQELWLLEIENPKYLRNMLWEGCQAVRGRKWGLRSRIWPGSWHSYLHRCFVPLQDNVCAGRSGLVWVSLLPAFQPGVPGDLGPKSLFICPELSSGGTFFSPSSIVGGCGDGERWVRGQQWADPASIPSIHPAGSRVEPAPAPWVSLVSRDAADLRDTPKTTLMSPCGSRAGLALAASAVVSQP